jgi:uncharacterized protein
MNKEKLIDFVTPYYANKDIMHNMWHIELVLKYVDRILKICHYNVDYDSLLYAAYFHGFIYSNESEIIGWLRFQNIDENKIQFIITVANESQRPEIPQTLEGKILHDAHVLEGGKQYSVVKCLITGSARGQTLSQTIDYIEKFIIDNNKCYLPETIPLCEESNEYLRTFIQTLKEDIR